MYNGGNSNTFLIFGGVTIYSEYENSVIEEFKNCNHDEIYNIHKKYVNISMFTYRFVMREMLKNMTSDGYCTVFYKGCKLWENLNIYFIVINKIIKFEKIYENIRVKFIMFTSDNKYLCELYYEPYWTDSYLRIIEKIEE